VTTGPEKYWIPTAAIGITASFTISTEKKNKCWIEHAANSKQVLDALSCLSEFTLLGHPIPDGKRDVKIYVFAHI